MKQILIVEDDELLNKMLVYNLQSESYGIVSVETVKEAMEVLKSQPFDLVLLDINLPDGDGYAIAKTIREKYSDTIVIFLTANDRESDEIRGYELGAVDYITKSFSIHSLQRKVENVLRMMRHTTEMVNGYRDNPILSYQAAEEQFKDQIDYDAIWIDRPFDRKLLNGDFISLCETMAELDFCDLLKHISCPVLVICGEKDKVNKKASKELADRLRHANFQEIPQTGHEVNLESPEKLSVVLKKFYESIGLTDSK